MGSDTDIHNWTMCIESETLEYSVINMISSSFQSPKDSRIFVEEEVERLLIVTVRSDGWHQANSVFLTKRTNAHVNSQKLWQQTEDLHSFKPDRVTALRGKKKVDVGYYSYPRSCMKLIHVGINKKSVLNFSGILTGYNKHTPLSHSK